MKKLLLIRFISTLLLLCGVVVGQEKAQDKAADSSNQPALTIYNQNFFVAREYVPLDLGPGVNHAQFAGIASHLEPDSVILRDPAGRSAADAGTELSQRSHLAGAVAFVLRRQDH